MHDQHPTGVGRASAPFLRSGTGKDDRVLKGKRGAYTPPIERMLARKFVDEDGCWIWPGAKNKVSARHGGGGYGQVRDTEAKKTLVVRRACRTCAYMTPAERAVS